MALRKSTRDLTGLTFRWLTVIGRCQEKRGRKPLWLCRCKCGGETRLTYRELGGNRPQVSCGCYHPPTNLTHGGRRGGKATPEYRTWLGIRRRCHHATSRGFHLYGGRGITVCDTWRHDFAAFLRDMGPRPSRQHSIERIDNNGPYSPENCKWATREEQGRNKRNNHLVTWDGRTQTLIEWANELGLTIYTLWRRLHRWPLERAMTEPLNPPH